MQAVHSLLQCSSTLKNESRDWVEGHPNHLTPDQEEKLSQFKRQCDKTGVENVLNKGSIDVSDATIL